MLCFHSLGKKYIRMGEVYNMDCEISPVVHKLNVLFAFKTGTADHKDE